MDFDSNMSECYGMQFLERSHLRVIREVDRRGSLTAASRALGLTQPALSHSIKQLEALSGAKIFVRQGRGLRRTEAGDHLLSLAERVLPQLEHAELVLAEIAEGGRGSLRVGMECHPCYRWLLSVVGPYLRAHPRVDLDVIQKFRFGGIGALFAREIDLLVTPDPLRKQGLTYVPVFDYELRLALGRQHRLANKRVLAPGDLSDETLITYPVEMGRLDVYTQFLQPAGIAPRRRKVIEDTDIMLQMVESQRGVTALPGWLIKEHTRRLKLRSIRLGQSGINKTIFLAIRESDARLAHLSAFIEMAKQGGRRRAARSSGPTPS